MHWIVDKMCDLMHRWCCPVNWACGRWEWFDRWYWKGL